MERVWNSGKVIVTGAASGIGKAIVNHCLQEQTAVIACDIKEDALYDLKQSMGGKERLYTYRLDISKYEEVEKFFEYVTEEHPDTNGLVNNAGIYLAKNIMQYEPEEIDRVLDINIKGAVYFSKFFGKCIFQSKRRGSIVNLSSVSALDGSTDAIYGLSKSALIGLTKSCAINYSPYIRVNAVAPTIVQTPMMSQIPAWRVEEYFASELIDTPVLPEDVADTVVFLLSEKAKHYTGATFDLNNGGYLR
ncbi:UNVERIFIED_CONTAM: SDR family NAD(P)-dependent oxidoreductase [Halobacillus marinus]